MASRRVRNSADFIVAGRQLPLGLCVFTVCATWFGSGTLIGAAGAAYTSGLRGVLANPFGSALCLLLAGILYARVLRRLRLLTLPDLFRLRFGRTAEIVSALSIIPAYIGWVGSTLVAFGMVLNVVVGFGFQTAIVAGAVLTIGYTFSGGMWAVSLTDFFQAILIIAGCLCYSRWSLTMSADGRDWPSKRQRNTFSWLPSSHSTAGSCSCRACS